MPRDPHKRPTPASKHRPGLGANPLDALLPDAGEDAPARRDVRSEGQGEASGKASTAAPSKAGARRKVSLYLSADLVERMRNAAVQLAGPPEHLTLTDLGERALDAEVTRLERKHNGGQPFPRRAGELRGGRPIGS